MFSLIIWLTNQWEISVFIDFAGATFVTVHQMVNYWQSVAEEMRVGVAARVEPGTPCGSLTP